MKKYLITGALALVAGVTLTSCHSDDELSGSIISQKVMAYEQVFEKEFGKVNPDQDWGFGDASRSRTRALYYNNAGSRTRSANPEGNQWCKTYSNVPEPLTDDQILRVRLYFQSHTFTQVIPQVFNTYFVQQVYKGGTTPGPNSAEKYPAADGQSDHFIVGGNQMDKLVVGADHVHVYNFNSADAGVYGNVKDGHTYVDGYVPWTEESAAAVGKSWADAQTENFNNLKEHPDKIMLMENTPTTSFGYWNSNSAQGRDDMYVCIDGSVIDEWAESLDEIPGESVSGRYFVGFDFEQVIDINYKDDNGVYQYFEYGNNQYHYLSQRMDQYAGTHTSRTDAQLYIDGDMAKGLNPATINELLTAGYLPVWGKDLREWVIPSRLADHYYSDWIVAITPALYINNSSSEIAIEQGSSYVERTYAQYAFMTTMAESGRIICEDLGTASASDIDFNDIVFDGYIYDIVPVKKTRVTMIKDNVETQLQDWSDWVTDDDHLSLGYTTTDVYLLAGGGTIPVTIAGYNLKTAFGTNDKTIVNTIDDRDSKDVKRYGNDYENNVSFKQPSGLRDIRYDANSEFKNIRTLNDIKVIVKYGSQIYELKAYKGAVPNKICVPITTKWPYERVEINTAYNFNDYVRTVTPKDTTVTYNGNNREKLTLIDEEGKEKVYYYINDRYNTNLWLNPTEAQKKNLYHGEDKYYKGVSDITAIPYASLLRTVDEILPRTENDGLPANNSYTEVTKTIDGGFNNQTDPVLIRRRN